MERYDAMVDDGVLRIETDDDPIEIGPMDDVCALVGGQTYTLQYDERQRTMDWLDTDSEGRLTFDVRETIAGMDFDRAFVADFAAIDADATDEAGYPRRASVFAERMTTIWEAKGALDDA